MAKERKSKLTRWIEREAAKRTPAALAAKAAAKIAGAKARAVAAKIRADAENERAMKLAVIIQASIKKSGTKPHPFIMPAWDANKDVYWKNVVARIEALRLL